MGFNCTCRFVDVGFVGFSRGFTGGFTWGEDLGCGGFGGGLNWGWYLFCGGFGGCKISGWYLCCKGFGWGLSWGWYLFWGALIGGGGGLIKGFALLEEGFCGLRFIGGDFCCDGFWGFWRCDGGGLVLCWMNSNSFKMAATRMMLPMTARMTATRLDTAGLGCGDSTKVLSVDENKID